MRFIMLLLLWPCFQTIAIVVTGIGLCYAQLPSGNQSHGKATRPAPLSPSYKENTFHGLVPNTDAGNIHSSKHVLATMPFQQPVSQDDFSVVDGYFVYTDPATDFDKLPALAPRFGLVEGMTWDKLIRDLEERNAEPQELGEEYKLVFLARHGQGWHNVAEEKYGTKAWDDHWAMLTTDGELTWAPDPELTSLGEQQARDANAMWKSLLASPDKGERPPLPEAYFSSPLARAANTLHITYDGLVPEEKRAVNDASDAAHGPWHIILEGLRENFAERHTCDARSKKSVVAKRWELHGWLIDPVMKEDDEIFASDLVESPEDMALRVESALSLIWRKTRGQLTINLTSHSGTMQALFRALGAIDFKPKTGAIVPLVIKATPRTSKMTQI